MNEICVIDGITSSAEIKEDQDGALHRASSFKDVISDFEQSYLCTML